MGVSQDIIESIFISERDNQRFMVRYGVSGMGCQAIILGAEGVGGMRMGLPATLFLKLALL